MDTQTKGRSIVQDMVKGVLILFVIYFHATLFGPLNARTEFNILYCVFPCLMSVFFFYSGYNYSPKGKTYKEKISHRAKQLLLPIPIVFITATLLVGGLQMITGNATLKTVLYGDLYLLLSEGGFDLLGIEMTAGNVDVIMAVGILWFLYVLFIVSAVFYLIIDWTIEKTSRYIAVTAVCVLLSFLIVQFIGVSLPHMVQAYPVILAIMLTGAFLKQKNFLDRPADSKRAIVSIIMTAIAFEAVIFISCYFCHVRFGADLVGAMAGGQFNAVIKGFDVILVFILSIMGTYVIHTLMRLLSMVKPISKLFGYIGKRVSLVYVTHATILSFVVTLIFHRDLSGLGQFYPLVLVLITITVFLVISFIIGAIIKKTRSSTRLKASNNDED
ncbi:MAG: acyltransferase family protein [Dehalococcoidales bacterium]|nr:acyltransferase family protein [Dehalococcoidales bacterium]